MKDLEALGEDSTVVLTGSMGPGAWGMVSQLYYMAAHGNPVGILGVAMATEGLGADLATSYAQALEKDYGFPHESTSFLRSHGVFDIGHTELVKKAVDTLLEPGELEEVVHGREMTIRYYSQLFTDVLDS